MTAIHKLRGCMQKAVISQYASQQYCKNKQLATTNLSTCLQVVLCMYQRVKNCTCVDLKSALIK